MSSLFLQRESKRGVGHVVFVLSKRMEERCRTCCLCSCKENQREVYNLLSLFFQRESKRGVEHVVFVLPKRALSFVYVYLHLYQNAEHSPIILIYR
jgi:hypothetical protein